AEHGGRPRQQDGLRRRHATELTPGEPEGAQQRVLTGPFDDRQAEGVGDPDEGDDDGDAEQAERRTPPRRRRPPRTPARRQHPGRWRMNAARSSRFLARPSPVIFVTSALPGEASREVEIVGGAPPVLVQSMAFSQALENSTDLA